MNRKASRNKPAKKLMKSTLLLSLLGLWLGIQLAGAQGSAFTYQGRLAASGQVTNNGLYDFTFQIFDALSGGSSSTGIVNTNGVVLINSLFTVTLDFGASSFNGALRWLEIGVRTNGGGAFTTLSPRQKLTPAPYAITASNLSGTLPAIQLSGALSDARLSANVALRAGGNAFSGNQSVTGGSMGIGTVSPGKALQVGDPSLPSEGMIRLASRAGSASRIWDIGVPQADETGIGYSFVVQDTSRPDPGLIIRWNSGNVGIGATNPAAKLEVNSSASQPLLRLNQANPVFTPTLSFAHNGVQAWDIGATSNRFSIYSGLFGLDFLVMDASGVRVGSLTANNITSLGAIEANGPITAVGGLIIENRNGSDPASPATGQIWLRTDL